MQKVEIRTAVWMAYEDHWFGKPWTAPDTVVMVHGNAESSLAWAAWVPHLAGKYRVIRLDMPGFGASTEPSGYSWTVQELAADVIRFLDAVGIEKCHLIGAKYGGSVCLELALMHPHRLLTLCLFGSPVRGSGTANADAIRGKGVRQWATETMRARLGSSASEANESGLQSVAAVERYAARIPDARVIVLPGDSYHVAAVEPDLCAQHALAFMEEIAARTAAHAPQAAQ